MNFLVMFTALSIVNVIFSTIRTITTVKAGKLVASLISAGYFGFYNIMLIYTVADFPLWQKCVITFACNLIGVFVVKLIEEKKQKLKLWEVRATALSQYTTMIDERLTAANIPHNYIQNVGKYTIFNCYCSTKKDSKFVHQLLDDYGAKYFIAESKDF